MAGAAVDVFSKEPPEDNILCKSDRIIVTPHLGASTAEAQERVALDVADQIVAIFRGEPPAYAVNAPLVPRGDDGDHRAVRRRGDQDVVAGYAVERGAAKQRRGGVSGRDRRLMT